jgi:16S rRNA A1518/A1519 N6-dimethyltransferase RsmA/KsgA/DIM1 with predicted DNA glycosylase/AP lyase activity
MDAEIDPAARAETLNLEQYARLAQRLPLDKANIPA